MRFKTCGLGVAFIAFLALSPANAKDEHQISLRNDVGRAITCGVRSANSSAIDSFTIREGGTWSKDYSGSKQRLVLCEGALSTWQPVAADRPYRLVKGAEDRILAEPDSGR
ncbi:MAG TPA: hypothetical protein VFW19_12960 [Allosphingosinicella sp.]|nr:hypothetical protein [Allosphingosinicella sp.]